MRLRRDKRDGEVFRITGARPSLAEDVRRRERRYVISMLVRTVAVILTVFLWNVQRPLAVVTLVLGLTLPYIAVVIANAGRENSPAIPSSLLRSAPREAIAPTGEGATGEGATGEGPAAERPAGGRPASEAPDEDSAGRAPTEGRPSPGRAAPRPEDGPATARPGGDHPRSGTNGSAHFSS
ncbi:DUF3099 domain-containing protein [Streptomyces sp. OF8]|uniref:DUF3099 domain-containing protein n=1 Tax=Streptomyces alkaliterrae TaxID=2213162 RepID=A0A5P0YJP8_9ACTN|nr:DUF3099 domain-containing protein [Streptomyces alkaliterrae]MQS00431.1 DUF3099 domain-containing protein [Streptomyces alkaliterrae]